MSDTVQTKKKKKKGEKLKIFQEIQKKLAIIGFLPKQQQITNRLLSKIQLCGLIATFVCTSLVIVYFFHVANSREDHMYTILSLTVSFAIGASEVSFVLQNDKVFDLIDSGEKIINEKISTNPESRKLYEKFNDITEKLTKLIYFIFVFAGLLITIYVKATIAYYKYYNTDAGRDAFELPFNSWYPFDWKNPLGFFIVICLQTVMIFRVTHYMASFGSLVIGAFIFGVAFAKDVCNDLRLLNEMIETKQPETEIFKKFIEFISFHSRVKQIIEDISDLLQVSILADFAHCTISICLIMLIIQQEIIHDAIGSSLFWSCIFLGICMLILAFSTCEIGQQFTNTLDKVDDKFNQLDWYLYPAKIQRIIPTVVNNVQKPVVIKCFGILTGSRTQFRKMAIFVYKTFNVLRKIYN